MLIKANGNNNWASLDEQFQITLLVLRDRHQSSERIVFLRHTHILNLFEELCKSGFCN